MAPDDKPEGPFMPLTLPGAAEAPQTPASVSDDVIERNLAELPGAAEASQTPASVSDDVIERNLAEQTRAILAMLTPREEKILRMRFGIDGAKADEEGTGVEVGADFEITRERIRQIEAKALGKLRGRRSAASTDDDETDGED